MPYMGRSNTGFGIRDRFQFTAAGSETSVSGSDDNGRTLKFSDGKYVDVYLNGVYLDSANDYNTTTANTIGGITALAANDYLEVVSYDIFSVADVVPSSGGTFSGNVTAASDFTVSGNHTVTGDLTVTGNIIGDIEITGTTPKLTIGDAGTEDSSLVFDGNAQDYYIALDDSADDLVIGLGSTVGTTPAISIDENLLVTVEDDVKVDGRAVGHVTTDNDGSFDLAVGNDFKCTSAGDLALTFTNAAAGQSGNIMFVNGSNHTITAAATVAINADVLSTISASGTYHLSYFCSAASGNDTILVSASAILT